MEVASPPSYADDSPPADVSPVPQFEQPSREEFIGFSDEKKCELFEIVCERNEELENLVKSGSEENTRLGALNEQLQSERDSSDSALLIVDAKLQKFKRLNYAKKETIAELTVRVKKLEDGWKENGRDDGLLAESVNNTRLANLAFDTVLQSMISDDVSLVFDAPVLYDSESYAKQLAEMKLEKGKRGLPALRKTYLRLEHEYYLKKDQLEISQDELRALAVKLHILETLGAEKFEEVDTKRANKIAALQFKKDRELAAAAQKKADEEQFKQIEAGVVSYIPGQKRSRPTYHALEADEGWEDDSATSKDEAQLQEGQARFEETKRKHQRRRVIPGSDADNIADD
eukprot:TRINITY_DN14922_c0_g1_i1.p1 TRINITY_DN14922_c0_g1~~TRINITY_DN14922_c0_g1_i1.p1  ORF type:complete len:360 (+),score=49.56 TRINITY_DN14922_c0_g1_i1:50-1081(+)